MVITERSYVKKAQRRNVLFGWICAEMYTFQGGKTAHFCRYCRLLHEMWDSP
jgi:hypothetical protein